jgi:hypothetical protein
MSCSNNLKQLGIACHNYQSTHQCLPPGSNGPPPPDAPGSGGFTWAGQHLGMLVYLLPYVEQDNIHRQILTPWLDTTANPVNDWWGNGTLWGLAQYRIKTFECPSDAEGVPTSGTFVTTYSKDYTFTGGYYPQPTSNVLGRTNYLGCAGAIGPSIDGFYGQWKGLQTNRSKNSIAIVPDGTSNTILLGETIGGANKGPRDFRMSWMGCGLMATAWGLPTGTSGWYQYSSNHTGGVVLFCFTDGSVRYARAGASATFFTGDWYVFQEMAGYIDGGVRPASLLN